MDVRKHQQEAWDAEARGGSQWSEAVSSEAVAAARAGSWSVVLTPQIPVPSEWIGEVAGREVLLLASGGGQQGPLFAAAGARVTVFDNSPEQLARDRLVAEREGLEIRLEEGDMADLARFAADSFDLIFHPCSNGFVPKVRPVWREAARVLRSGGHLLAGFANPVVYLFDPDQKDGELVATNEIPYSDLTHRSEQDLAHRIAQKRPLEFGHTLGDQIGGQLDAGLLLCGFYEDRQLGYEIDRMIPTYIATRARKP